MVNLIQVTNAKLLKNALNEIIATTALKVEAVGSFEFSVDPVTYVLSLQAKDISGNNLGSPVTVDLPLESIISSATYYATYTYSGTTYTRVIVITLATTDVPTIIPVGDLIVGLQNEITSENKLSADLIEDGVTNKAYTATEQTKLSNIESGAQVNTVNKVNNKTGDVVLDADDIDDTNTTHKFVSTTEKNTWDAKQDLISSSNKISADNVDDTSTTNKFITTSEKTKLSGIESGAQVNTVTGVKGNAENSYRTGNINITPDDLDDTNTTHKFVSASEKADIASVGGINTRLTTAEGNIVTLQGAVSNLQNSISSKASIGIIKTYILKSTNWVNNAQTLTILGKTSNFNARVNNWQDGTAQEVLANSKAISDANIYQIIDNGTSLTFVCETTPTVDLKINIELFEAVEIKEPYLTFSSDNSFTLNVVDFTKYWDGTLEYSTDKTTWNVWDGTTTLSSGAENELYLRGTGNTVITGAFIGQNNKRWVLTGSGINCIGNIENLLDYATVKLGNHPPMASYCFTHLFRYSTSLVSAPELPATTLSDYCYQQMFQNCTSLVNAPATLPATTLATSCYDAMFYNCTSLTTAPALPATTLAYGCYGQMFSLCSSLTTAPTLPATTLADYCYYCMFEGCSNLTTIPALPATTLTEGCYCNMFSMCTSLTTLPALPATTLPDACYMGMFGECSEIKISEMPSSEYPNFYQIPISDMGTAEEHALDYMFLDTGGTFTGTPNINTTYFTSNAIINTDGTITPGVEVE